ncbi:MAG: GIY-YIG nuclease family protein [FCB group bacterium]|nr:GIY-YIG nuclease family protein [FCB group bacterium]
MTDYNFYTYILTNKSKKVLYTGVTNDLRRRLYEHKHIEKHSFCKKYNCFYLVYYEWFRNIEHAIDREKQIKRWRREKKVRLIEQFNPQWQFLNDIVIDD